MTSSLAAGHARRLALIVLVTWLAMIGFDFFLHAGLLAALYVEPSPFLLTPLESFQRLPIGYLSFLLSAVLLVWLMVRLRTDGWSAGFAFGLKLGALVWGAGNLGMLSISTASTSLLAGWFFGQTLELALAGAVAGHALAGHPIGKLALKVFVLVLVLAAFTIVLQNTGIAPAAGIPRD